MFAHVQGVMKGYTRLSMIIFGEGTMEGVEDTFSFHRTPLQY